MAHYIAEQITAAESAGESDRTARHRHPHRPQMHTFERVFLALERLAEPQDLWRFYRPFPEGTEPSPEDVISSTLLSLALNVEDSAREIVRALVAEAAATALDHEAQWVRLSENLAEDEERQAIRRLDRLMRLSDESLDNPEDMDPLERVRAHITRTIGQLTAISDAITEVRGQEP